MGATFFFHPLLYRVILSRSDITQENVHVADHSILTLKHLSINKRPNSIVALSAVVTKYNEKAQSFVHSSVSRGRYMSVSTAERSTDEFCCDFATGLFV